MKEVYNIAIHIIILNRTSRCYQVTSKCQSQRDEQPASAYRLFASVVVRMIQ